MTQQNQKQFLFMIGKLYVASSSSLSRIIARQTGHTRQSTICLYLCQAFTDLKKKFSTEFSDKCIVKCSRITHQTHLKCAATLP